MKQTKISMNLDGLDDLKKAVGTSLRARVGILGNHAARTQPGGSINNAELGLIQMFGSVTNNIPARDFLLMPIETKKRELLKAMGGSASREAFARKDFTKMFEILGTTAVGFVDEAFATGGFGQWPPNTPSTVAQKGSSAPLIDTGELRKSISFDVVKAGSSKLSIGNPGAP